MESDTQTFRIKIDGRWTALEMAESHLAIRELYNIYLWIGAVHYKQSKLAASEMYPPALPPDLSARIELSVRQIQYASPGFKDLAGIGEVVGHIRDLIIHLIENHNSERIGNWKRRRRRY